MVRNIIVFSGSSHTGLTDKICEHLGIGPGNILLSKFSVGETRVEVGESVRGKDVFIVQSACSTKKGNSGMSLNDGLMELLITISACKTASARRVTVVLPLFPYSRQTETPYNKAGAPLARMPTKTAQDAKYTFESRPGTPGPSQPRDEALEKKMNGMKMNGELTLPRKRTDTLDSVQSDVSTTSQNGAKDKDSKIPTSNSKQTTQPPTEFKPQKGYQQWMAQAGNLIANLLTNAGADHVITMDLHDPQYQGFFDIPVDNLYGRHLLRRYLAYDILPAEGGPDNCIIVSPDAGGAKRATSIADSLGMEFALIHKERANAAPGQGRAMLLVGDVAGKTCVLIDDMADTSNTITRAAKMLKKEGAHKVYALVTHGVLSGDGVERIFQSQLDTVVVTNSVPQADHVRRMDELSEQYGKPKGKLVIVDIASVFAEAIRRVHHGESISALFQYD